MTDLLLPVHAATVDGLGTPSLAPARTRHTPYLDFDVAYAVATYRRLAAALPGTALHYAVKANPDPVLLAALARSGCRFDVASPAEITAALMAGAGPGDLVYSNPVKRREDVRFAARLGVDLFVVDSPGEVAKVAEAAPGSRVLCRLVTSGDGSDWPLSRKYGCSTGEAVTILRDAARLGLRVDGISFHVGSQQRDPEAWAAPIRSAATVFEALRADGLDPWLLDLGGGFPARLDAGCPAPEAYGAAIDRHLAAAFGDHRPTTIAEPGRGIAADAGVLVTTVIGVLHRAGTRWVFLDAGVFTGLVETLDEAIRYPLATDVARPDRTVRALRPDLRQRGRALRGRDGRAAAGAGRGRPGAVPLRGRLHGDVLHGRVQRVRTARHRGEGMTHPRNCAAGALRASGRTSAGPRKSVSSHRASRPVVPRLLTAYACASIATGLLWPLLLVLVWDQYADGPHGAWIVGLAGAARMVPYVLLSWAVGSLGDHVRRDRLVRATMALRLLFLAAAGVAVATDRVGLGVVAAALAVAVGTPAYPAIAASLPELAGARRMRATQALVTIEVSSWVVGPALGGLLLAQSLRDWTRAGSGRTGGRRAGADDGHPHSRSSGQGTRRSRRDAARSSGTPARRSARSGSPGCSTWCATATGMVLLPLSTDSWGRGDAGFGLATAFLGFGALGAPVLGRLVRVTRSGGLLALAGAVLLVALSPGPWPALPLLALIGATGVVIESLLTATLQDAVPDRYRAGALGLADTVMVGACLVGSLVAPALAEHAGARTALLVVALSAVLPLLAVRLLPYRSPSTPYDASGERPPARPDPRGAPAVGAARVG